MDLVISCIQIACHDPSNRLDILFLDSFGLSTSHMRSPERSQVNPGEPGKLDCPGHVRALQKEGCAAIDPPDGSFALRRDIFRAVFLSRGPGEGRE